MRARAFYLLAASAISLALGASARADTGNPQLDHAIGLYNDLDYEQALEALEPALAQPGLRREQLVEGYKYLALAHVALGHDDQAREAFRKLLEADPRYELPRTETPRAIDLFAEVKATIRNYVQLLHTSSPVHPRPGLPVEIQVVTVDESGAVAQVTVYHRQHGQKAWSHVSAAPVAGRPGRYTATISGVFVADAPLEYYLVAQAGDGNALATNGGETEPLVLTIEHAGSRSVVKSWWFWATVGGVLVAGAVAVVLVTASSSDNASVTVTAGYGQ